MSTNGEPTISRLREWSGRIRRRAEFGDALLFLYTLVFVRQFLWTLPSDALAWLLTVVLACVVWGAYVAAKEAEEERLPRAFLYVVALPLLLVYLLRVAFVDLSFDVANYHIALGERSLHGLPFRAGDFFPFFSVNPAPDMVTALMRAALGYRLGTLVNYVALLWTGAILYRLLPFRRPLLRAGLVLAVLFTEHILFEINNYMVDLLSLPLLLEATRIVLRRDEADGRDAARPTRHLFQLALLTGMAVAFKLTNLAFVIPLALLYGFDLLRQRAHVDRRELVRLLPALLIFLAPIAPFSVFIYRETGNPIFPFYNPVFKSPYWPDWPNPGGWDGRWGPQGPIETLLWPFALLFRLARVAEIPVYSGRLTIACAVSVICLLLARFARVERRVLRLSFITLAGALLWSATSGYVRYVTYLELTGGLVIAASVAQLLRRQESKTRAPLATLAVVLLAASAAQIVAAAVYTLRYEWAMRPSLLTESRLYRREASYLLRDRSLKRFLSEEDRAAIAPVEAWVESDMKTSGIMMLLKPGAPLVNARTPEFFFSAQGKDKFARTINSLAGRKLYSLSFVEDLGQSLDLISKRGLEPGPVTFLKVPFYSSYVRPGMALIEINAPPGGLRVEQVENSAAGNSYAPSPYRYQINIRNTPEVMRAGQKLVLDLLVRNMSDVTWSNRGKEGSPYPVGIGNHWLDTDNRMVTHDDGRSTIPHDLPPGEEARLPLEIHAPAAPGDYTLEIDMLREGVTWFAHAGARTVRLRVRVEP